MRTRLWLVAAAVALVAADPPKADPAKDELAIIQGTWRMVSAEANGMKMPEEQAKAITRTITGDKYEITRNGQPAGKGTMTLDPTKTPRTVDAETTVRGEDGTPKAVKLQGIYELDGDTMRTCLAEPGKDRPTEFATKPGSGHRLYVWKREKTEKK
ncbi:MAG TPA: TIGR03067 domain-containing protein [Gemmataceae bacterium]|jgi:uncharacterized protein (TIGR03067 family)